MVLPAWHLKNILVNVAESIPVSLLLDAQLPPFFQKEIGKTKGAVCGKSPGVMEGQL